MRKLAAVWAMIAMMSGTAATAATETPAPVEVMVVGTWHFGNPGQDLINVESADVTTAQRQVELEAIAAALAEFRPTKVMVERVAPESDLLDPRYAAFDPAQLATVRDERVQIGYRLAHRLGHRTVWAIDEQAKDGEPDYFPFGRLIAWDRAHGAGDLPQRVQARGAAMMRDFAEMQARASLAEMLVHANAPGAQGGISGYYDMLRIGGVDDQPGAELNALWYMRNAKIFAKLMLAAEPGDRILVVYGAGHNYWLRHFAAETPGFRNVDPRPYLARAAAESR
ncbi:MAG: DUF5694 domain-containing protein [Allosphingosinicella sp.]|uniref:DUF5694 domain-containing protein n=1 Tax=Allosphingosinicella sp. TaxID=2823234 RepID=UPI0039584CCD